MEEPVDYRAAARRWTSAWREGWAALDTERILACYARDATLRAAPLREPVPAVEYVPRVFDEEEDPQVTFGEPIVDGAQAAVAWWAHLREEGEDMTLAGISLLRFSDEGLVVEQWDAFDARPGRRASPPDGWPLAGPPG